MGVWSSKQKVSVLVIGLDNSGKTMLINKLKPEGTGAREIAPTVGFSVDAFSQYDIDFDVFDMSGQGRYRNLWDYYYKDVGAIMFVIDTADKLRMCVVKDELDAMLRNADVPRVPILFFANKMDLPQAFSRVECAQILKLEEIRDKPWQIISSNALTGEGLDEGIAWLAERCKAA